MSVPTPPPSTPDQTATATTSRRKWHDSKPKLVIVALIAGALLGGMATSGGDTTSTSNDEPATASASSSPKTAGKAKPKAKTDGTVGVAVKNAGTEYTVTKARTSTTLGDPNVLGEKAEAGAVFVIVDLTLLNGKDETKTFSDTSAKLKAGGASYSTTDKALFALGDKGLLLKEIQPDLPTSGTLAFEVPAKRAKGSVLVIEDLFGDGEVKIDLGL